MMKRLNLPILLTLGFFLVVYLSWSGTLDLYTQSVLMYMGINIMLASSLNLINGYMGEFSCGHAGFMAVGAYAGSVLNVVLFTRNDLVGAALLPPEYSVFFFPLILAAGFVAAALAGIVVAIPSFKTRGDYLAIITLAANFIITSAVINISSIGGSRGFMGMKKIVFAMEDVADLPWMIIWTFLATVFTIWIIRRFVSSTYGKGILAIHQDEIAAEIMSVNTNRMKLAAFMFSSGLAGMAGVLFAHILGYINPGSFGILKSTECMVMVYLGGMGSLGGSVIAAIGVTLMIEGLRFIIPAIDSGLHAVSLLPDAYHLSQVWKWVLIPLTLVLLMQFRPEGILGNRELTDVFPRLKRWFTFK